MHVLNINQSIKHKYIGINNAIKKSSLQTPVLFSSSMHLCKYGHTLPTIIYLYSVQIVVLNYSCYVYPFKPSYNNTNGGLDGKLHSDYISLSETEKVGVKKLGITIREKAAPGQKTLWDYDDKMGIQERLEEKKQYSTMTWQAVKQQSIVRTRFSFPLSLSMMFSIISWPCICVTKYSIQQYIKFPLHIFDNQYHCNSCTVHCYYCQGTKCLNTNTKIRQSHQK